MREHRLKRRVLFYEVDLAGIAHFSSYFRYMEEAEHALWREAGLQVAPADRTIGFPRVSATCDYHAPLRFEDEFEVHVRIEAINRRSIKYAHAITRGGTKIATGAITTVCVTGGDGTPMRAIEIPEEIAEKLRG